MGHPAPTGVNVGDYFRFSCNPELGTEHGALHWQCVFAVKVLPYGWRDPAKRRPEYVEIDVVRCDRFGLLSCAPYPDWCSGCVWASWLGLA